MHVLRMPVCPLRCSRTVLAIAQHAATPPQTTGCQVIVRGAVHTWGYLDAKREAQSRLKQTSLSPLNPSVLFTTLSLPAPVGHILLGKWCTAFGVA